MLRLRRGFSRGPSIPVNVLVRGERYDMIKPAGNETMLHDQMLRDSLMVSYALLGDFYVNSISSVGYLMMSVFNYL